MPGTFINFFEFLGGRLFEEAFKRGGRLLHFCETLLFFLNINFIHQ